MLKRLERLLGRRPVLILVVTVLALSPWCLVLVYLLLVATLLARK